MMKTLFEALFLTLVTQACVEAVSPPIILPKLDISPEDMETAIKILPQLAPFFGVDESCELNLESVLGSKTNVSNGIINTIMDLKISSQCSPDPKICSNIHVLKPKKCESCEKLVDVSKISCIPDFIVDPGFIFGGSIEIENPSSNPIISKIAQEATKFLYGHFNTSTPCPIHLKDIIRAKQQAVMGFNYEFELQVETNSADFNCEYLLLNCDNIHIHEPIAEHCPHGEQSCIVPVNLQDINCVNVDLVFNSKAVLIGGYTERAIDREIIAVASGVAEQLMSSFGAPENCHLEVEKVLKAQSQVVAGTNFIMDIELSSQGPDCDTERKVCKNIKIFRPLPFNCNGEETCFELTETESIECVSSDMTDSYKREVGAEAAKFLYHFFNTDNVCQIEVKNVELQIMSSDHYKLDLHLETKHGQQGCHIEKKACHNVNVRDLKDLDKCPHDSKPCLVPLQLDSVNCTDE